jgi:predicted metal-binding membrane protein
MNKSYIEASIVNCAFAVLVWVLRMKAGMISTVTKVLQVQIMATQQQPPDTNIEKLFNLGTSITGYLSLISAILVLSSIWYLVKSNKRRAFPVVALVMSIGCLVGTLIVE